MTAAAKTASSLVDPVAESFARAERVTKPETEKRKARRALALHEARNGLFVDVDALIKA